MSFHEEYQRKLCTAEEAARMIQSGDNFVAPMGMGHPRKILDAIAERKDELKGCTFLPTVDLYPSKIFEIEDNDHIEVDPGFVGPQTRKRVQEGIHTYSPMKLGDAPQVVFDNLRHFPIVVCVVSPMDKHGYFSLGCAVDYILACIKKAEKVLVEVNKNMPRAHGKCWVHISQIDAIVENDVPLPALPSIPPNEKDEAIGKLVAEQVLDGSTIQIGFGGIPNAVANFLENKNDLGVHTEVLTDAVFRLQKKGVVTNKYKNYLPDISVASFAAGSMEMYEWIDDNPAVGMYPVEIVNDPFIIGSNDNVISVNAALTVDLTGQVAAESFGPLQHSGVGGQVDFVLGAWRSRGGKSFISLYSSAKKNTVSRIVPLLPYGTFVTTARNETHYVVTEYGIALIKGQSIRQRARNLIAIAHPDFREQLTFEAKKLGFL